MTGESNTPSVPYYVEIAKSVRMRSSGWLKKGTRVKVWQDDGKDVVGIEWRVAEGHYRGNYVAALEREFLGAVRGPE